MRKLILLFLMLLVMTACNAGNAEQQTSELRLLKTSNSIPLQLDNKLIKDPDLIKEIEKEVYSFKEIYDVVILQGKKEILVAYKVRHLQRFRLKKIEKELNSVLEKKFPGENFVVSSDFKIFLEAIRLQRNINKDNLSNEEIERKLQKIIKLKNELT